MPNVSLPSSSTFEALFRYAFQRDFGKTPEDFFGITDKSSWHFNMSLNKMLTEFDAHIRDLYFDLVTPRRVCRAALPLSGELRRAVSHEMRGNPQKSRNTSPSVTRT